MKMTANRGYPYPECNPPFVKDQANLPLQLHDLAEAIDTDLDVAQAAALAALNPPGADMVNTGAQVLVPGQQVAMGTTRFDNDSIADLANSRYVINHAGLYLITGSVNSTVSPTVFSNLSLIVSNSILVTESIDPNSAGGNPLESCVTGVAILGAGDTVTMSQNFTGAASITYQFAHLSIVRVVKI